MSKDFHTALLRVPRNQSGMYLVECLVALVMASFLCEALIYNLSQAMQVSQMSQNEVLAGAICQEVLDNARNQGYGVLSVAPYISSATQLVVNQTSSGQSMPAVLPRPLLQDQVNFTWNGGSKGNGSQANVNASGNAFDGSVVEQIATGPIANTLLVTVTCVWTEGAEKTRAFTVGGISLDGNKSLREATVISQWGITNNP